MNNMNFDEDKHSKNERNRRNEHANENGFPDDAKKNGAALRGEQDSSNDSSSTGKTIKKCSGLDEGDKIRKEKMVNNEDDEGITGDELSENESSDSDTDEYDDEEDGSDLESEDEEDDNEEEDDVDIQFVRRNKRKDVFNSDSNSSSDDDQSERCPICLSRFLSQQIGTPESCDHSFCLDCIQEWARNVNTCPVDRQVFSFILVRHRLEGKILRKILVENKQLEEDNEEDQTFCEICGRSDREDRLLLCDGCDMGYHLECLDPPLSAVPIEEWYCPDCAVENQLPLAEEIGIHEDELAGLLADSPPELGLPLIRPRGRRMVARTRQSERVRRVILRNRTAIGNTRREDQPSTSGIESQSDSTNRTLKPPLRAKKASKKKTTRRRKRKTDKKLARVGAKTTAKRKRRRKKRKSRKGKKIKLKRTRVILPQSIKARIANHLGLKKPPPGHTLPLMKPPIHEKTLHHQRYDVGIPALHIFGGRDALDSFEESYADGDMLISHPVLPRTNARRKAMFSSCSLSHPRHSNSNAFGNTLLRKLPEVPSATSVSDSSPFDLIGSIINGQSILHVRSKDVSINRDGSLHLLQRLRGEQISRQTPTNPCSSSKTGGRAGSTSSISSSNRHNQGNSVECPSYGRWPSLVNDNTTGQPYAEYFRSAGSSEGTQSFNDGNNDSPANGKSGTDALVNNDNNPKEKNNKKSEKEKKSTTAEYDDIDIYSDIEAGFENSEPYPEVEDTMLTTGMDLAQDDCANHSDISSEDDLVIDESIKQDDEEVPDQDHVSNNELSDDDAENSSSNNDDLVIDEEQDHNSSHSCISCDIDVLDENDENDSDDDNEQSESGSKNQTKARNLQEPSGEFQGSPMSRDEREYSETDENKNEIDQDEDENDGEEEEKDNGDVEDDKDDGDDADEDGEEIEEDEKEEVEDEEEEEEDDEEQSCNEDQGENNYTELTDRNAEEEQSDIEVDVEDLTEHEHEELSDIDVEEDNQKLDMSCNKDQGRSGDENDPADDSEDDQNNPKSASVDENKAVNSDDDKNAISDEDNEEIVVDSNHSQSESDEECVQERHDSPIEDKHMEHEDTKMQDNEENLVSETDVDVLSQEKDVEAIDNFPPRSPIAESEDAFNEIKVVNVINKFGHYDFDKQSNGPGNLKVTVGDESTPNDRKKTKVVADGEQEAMEEGEIVSQEDTEKRRHRKKRETDTQRSTRHSHHGPSSKSHKELADQEEGEIVDDSPPRRTRERMKTVMPRKEAVTELPRIPKIKRDKNPEITENLTLVSNEPKRTSVLSRLDAGGTSEISWKKLSKSSKERNYRDGKPKDENKYFREREIKEKKVEKKRKSDLAEKKEKKCLEHDKHSNKKEWPREKEKEKHEKHVSDREKDRHKDKHRNKHKEKDRHKHARSTEMSQDRRKDRDRREREVHEKREKQEKKEKEKKEKREKSRSGERPHREEKHREHKKKVEKIVLADRETSPVESKEVYTSGDSIIVNVSFNRSLNRDGKARDSKNKNKENRETKRNLSAEGGREHKKMKTIELDTTWNEKINSVPNEKPPNKNFTPPSPPLLPPLPAPIREHKRKLESNRKDVKTPESPRAPSTKWKPICDEEEDEVEIDNILDTAAADKAINDSDSDNCIILDGPESIQSLEDRESIRSDNEIEVEVQNENSSSHMPPISSPPDNTKINEDSMINSEVAEDISKSPLSPSDDAAYDPFEPTKSPSLSPIEMSEKKQPGENIESRGSGLLEPPEMPPLPPELPPLPPEPEPRELPPIPLKEVLPHPSPPFTMQKLPKGTIQLSPTPITLPNVRVPPPNFIPRGLPPNGTAAIQMAPQIRSMGWAIGTPGVLYTAPAQPMIRGGFLPPTLSSAPVPVSTQSLSQIGTLLHAQTQLAMMGGMRAPSGHGMPGVPPSISIPPPLLNCPPPPQMTHSNMSLHQVVANMSQNGEMCRTSVHTQQDVTEVVDMDVESPYSPGEDFEDNSMPEKKPQPPTMVHQERSADKFDLLMGPAKAIASKVQEKTPLPQVQKSKSVADHRSSRQILAPSQHRVDSRINSGSTTASAGSTDMKRRNSDAYSSSSKKHIVRFEMPDRKVVQKKDKKTDEANKKEVTIKLDETQLKILDELPSSAVEMQVKEKFLKKLNRQERVIEEVKLALKPYYNRREVTKAEYKEILRRSVPKICHNKSGEINPVKIRALVEGYVKKFKYHRKKDTKFPPLGGKGKS